MAVSNKLTGAYQRVVRALSYWPRTLRLIWQAAPGWNVSWFVLLTFQGVLPAASIYLSKLLVDSLVAAKTAGGAWHQVSRALTLLVVTALVLLLSDVLQSVLDWIRGSQSELVIDHIRNLVHEKATELDLSFYESAEYHDLLEQARTEAANRPVSLLENLGGLLQNSITLVAMGALLFTYGVWLPLLLLASTLPAFYVVLSFDRRYHRWWQRMTADRRWASYYDAMLTHSIPAAELRLFGLGGYYRAAFQGVRKRLREEKLRQTRKLTLAKAAAGLAALLVSGAAMLWMGWRALNGFATLGDLALFYQAFNRGQSLMRQLLGGVGQTITNSLYLSNLFTFLELRPKVTPPADPVPVPDPIRRGIEFRDVTFYYPGSERPALSNFNLFIPAGKIVAIVGLNGAGKSTLLKLLCRFYEPQSGRIEIDGVDIRDMAPADLWRSITVLFQSHMQYHATARTNISLGDVGSDLQHDDIEAAARRAGAHDVISRLPAGYDTLLGKWFLSGAELSEGEWQRIALARAYVRNSQIILLDEPTSFMDSWSESDWFARLRALGRGRTGVVITHRFTIAMRADHIHVMDGGRIVESGTHAELLSQGGFYSRSWAEQTGFHARKAVEDVGAERPAEALVLS